MGNLFPVSSHKAETKDSGAKVAAITGGEEPTDVMQRTLSPIGKYVLGMTGKTRTRGIIRTRQAALSPASSVSLSEN